MNSLNDWINYINDNVSNMSAEVEEFLPGHEHINIKLYGYEALTVFPLYNVDREEVLADLINDDMDVLELELTDGYDSTIIKNASPYGLIEYIEAVY